MSKPPTPNPDVPQPANPTPPGPGPKPGGPTHPPTRFVDTVFDLAQSLGPDTAIDLARPHKPRPPSKPPRKPINTKPIRAAFPSGYDRAGASTPRPGAVPKPEMPKPPGPPQFGGDDRPTPGHPGPPPKPPFPPPPLGAGVLYDALPPVGRCADGWPKPSRQIPPQP